MWKANITAVAPDETASIAKVTIRYSNDDSRTKEVTERISDPESIKKIVSDGLRELNRIDSINDLIAKPTLGEVQFPPPVQPTQADKDLASFQKWLGLVQLLAAAKTLDWITGSEQVVQDAKAKVMALGTVNIPKLFQ